jgi:hypothetical protein
MIKLWEATAPVSFAVWLAQKRLKCSKEPSISTDSIKTTAGTCEKKLVDAATQTQTLVFQADLPYDRRLASRNAVFYLTIIRVVVWILCRTLLDIWTVYSIWYEGLFPFGHGSQNLTFGNKIQLWLAAPLFWFGLNPYWLYRMLISFSLLRRPFPLQISLRRFSFIGFRTAVGFKKRL